MRSSGLSRLRSSDLMLRLARLQAPACLGRLSLAHLLPCLLLLLVGGSLGLSRF